MVTSNLRSSRPANLESFADFTLFVVDITSRYEDGFLPRAGGWLDQDNFYVRMIQEGLAAKREREKIEDRKSKARANMRKKR